MGKKKSAFWRGVHNYMGQGHSKKRAIQLMSAEMGRRGNKRFKPKKWRGHGPTKFRRPREDLSPKESHIPSLKKPSVLSRIKMPGFLSGLALRYKLLIILILFNILMILMFPSSDGSKGFVLFIDVIFFFIWLWGWSRSCPNCHKHFTRKLVNTIFLGAHTSWKDEDRVTTHRDKNGNIKGTSTVRSRSPVTVHTIQNHWVCKRCGHSWSGRVHDKKQ